MEKQESRLVTVKFCDFCGNESTHLKKCAICKKDMCGENGNAKHCAYSVQDIYRYNDAARNVDRGICKECAGKKTNLTIGQLLDAMMGKSPVPTIYPLIADGVTVKTTQPNMALRKEWTDEAWSQRKWGVQGKILTHHDSHGLCYELRHEDGTTGCYDPSELEVVKN